MKNPTLESSRLRLRPLTATDAHALFALFQDQETIRYWPTAPHQETVSTAQMLKDLLQPPQACWWAVCHRDADTAVGFVGFLGNEGVPGMGYILRRDLWGKGYTTEAMRLALDYGFHTRHNDRIELWIHEDNIASQRVADKLGFNKKGRLRAMFPGRNQAHDMLVYGLRANEWVDTAMPQNNAHRFYNLQPVIPVPDINETMHFYQSKLGFTKEFIHGDPPFYASVVRGEWTPTVVRIHFNQSKKKTNNQAAGYLYITVGPGIDSLFQTFVGNGVTVVQQPSNQPWQMREFVIADNNGCQLRFGTQI